MLYRFANFLLLFLHLCHILNCFPILEQSKEECEYLIELAKPHMQKSSVVDSETGKSKDSRFAHRTLLLIYYKTIYQLKQKFDLDQNPHMTFFCRVRTSSGTFLARGRDKIIRDIEKRIADFSFVPVGERIYSYLDI